MRKHFVGATVAGLTLIGGAALAQDGASRSCLEYDQVDAIHQMGTSSVVLEVDGGQTLYHLQVENECFTGHSFDTAIRIVGGGDDTCMRTTDTVHYGRKTCRIEGVDIIQTQEQLDQLLALGVD